MNNTFSIVVPIHGERSGEIAIKSLLNQQRISRTQYEIIVVNDGGKNGDYARLQADKYIEHPDRFERAISLNDGMLLAENDWILHLDSDDEFISTTLYNLDYCVTKYPEYKLFHWGGIVQWEPKAEDEPDYDPRTTIRPTPELPDGEPGMGFFPTGLIASGHFMFHKSVYQELGGYPAEMSPYIFADKAAEEFPELRTMMEERHVDSLGNPWGNDFYIYYKYTRKYKGKALPLNLYLQHIRR